MQALRCARGELPTSRLVSSPDGGQIQAGFGVGKQSRQNELLVRLHALFRLRLHTHFDPITGWQVLEKVLRDLQLHGVATDLLDRG